MGTIEEDGGLQTYDYPQYVKGVQLATPHTPCRISHQDAPDSEICGIIVGIIDGGI